MHQATTKAKLNSCTGLKKKADGHAGWAVWLGSLSSFLSFNSSVLLSHFGPSYSRSSNCKRNGSHHHHHPLFYCRLPPLSFIHTVYTRVISLVLKISRWIFQLKAPFKVMECYSSFFLSTTSTKLIKAARTLWFKSWLLLPLFLSYEPNELLWPSSFFSSD